MESDRVPIEIVQLTDLGAQSRGSVVFGIRFGETRLSFEVTPPEYGAAVTFLLIGLMEGLRTGGVESEAVIGEGSKIRLAASLTGALLLYDDRSDDDPDEFETWPDAIAALFTRLSGEGSVTLD